MKEQKLFAISKLPWKERKDFYKDNGVDLRKIGTEGRIEPDYDEIEREDKKRQEEERGVR